MLDEFVTGRAHPALAGVVTRYLGYREHSAAPLRRRQAPSGGCPLIIGFGEPLSLDGPAGRSRPTAFVAGLQDGPVITEFTGHQAGVQVDLAPLGLWRLLRRPMHELSGQVPALDALALPALAALPERLADAPDWPTRFALVDAVLLGLLDGSTPPAPEVAHAWSALTASGDARIVDLAAATGWSRRHLLTRFREQVGVAPKLAGRVLRFSRAAGLVAGGAPDLTDVAVSCGFFDHAHLDREFRALARCTPTRFAEEWRASSPTSKPAEDADH